MITADEIAKIVDLKAKGYSQTKIAKELSISRATVSRHWSGRDGKKLSLDALFLMGECPQCGAEYPKPKFMPAWRCPYCKTGFSWKVPQFQPENPVICSSESTERR